MSIRKIRLFLDMDGTLARFYEQDDCLERMWEDGFFENLNSYAEMVAAMKIIIEQRKDIEVFVLSAVNTFSAGLEKINWLKKYMPEIKEENIIICNFGENKAEKVPNGISENDILVDDYTANLLNWKNSGGTAIKAINEINDKTKKWDGKRIEIEKSAMHIVEDFNKLV